MEGLQSKWTKKVYPLIRHQDSSIGTLNTKCKDLEVDFDFIIQNYVWDVWSMEQCVIHNKQTLEIIEKSFQDRHGTSLSMYDTLFQDNASRMRHKVVNLINTCEIFFAKNQENRILTIDLIKDIHRHVMDGLLDHPGEFRTVHVSTQYFSQRVYAAPSVIKQRLDTLINDYNNIIPTLKNFEQHIALGATFLEIFLHIHPFRNGNGRTGRILFSILLESHSVIPLSIFRTHPLDMDGNRKGYLEALNIAQGGPGFQATPIYFVRFVFDCVYAQLYNLWDTFGTNHVL